MRSKYWRAAAVPASPQLIRHLGALADAMMNPHRMDSTKGRIVKRSIANGHSFTYVTSPGRNCVGLYQIEIRCLRELGTILREISEGRDARQLFRQNERKKPKKTEEHQIRALGYWSVRALNPRAKDTRALAKARAILPKGMHLSDATIRKIAQRYRDSCIGERQGLLRFGKTIKDPIFDKQILRLRTEDQIKSLREYLRKKSARCG